MLWDGGDGDSDGVGSKKYLWCRFNTYLWPCFCDSRGLKTNLRILRLSVRCSVIVSMNKRLRLLIGQVIDKNSLLLLKISSCVNPYLFFINVIALLTESRSPCLRYVNIFSRIVEHLEDLWKRCNYSFGLPIPSTNKDNFPSSSSSCSSSNNKMYLYRRGIQFLSLRWLPCRLYYTKISTVFYLIVYKIKIKRTFGGFLTPFW